VSRAICVRCGSDRTDFRSICPSCGHRPIDEGLLTAWLLSSEHLSDEQLDTAASRIREGHPLRPSDRQLAQARKALGRAFATDPGLDLPVRLGLLATSLILTPLPAWICFAWWLSSRPRAAWQSLGMAVPGTVIYGALGLYLLLGPTVRSYL
jgi:hypothetical protein